MVTVFYHLSLLLLAPLCRVNTIVEINLLWHHKGNWYLSQMSDNTPSQLSPNFQVVTFRMQTRKTTCRLTSPMGNSKGFWFLRFWTWLHCYLCGTVLRTFTSIHHTAPLPLQMGPIVQWSLNHSATLWGIYLVTPSDCQTCRWHPACLWCFAIREIDPADVSVLSPAAATSRRFISFPLSFPAWKRSDEPREDDGRWQVINSGTHSLTHIDLQRNKLHH